MLIGGGIFREELTKDKAYKLIIENDLTTFWPSLLKAMGE